MNDDQFDDDEFDHEQLLEQLVIGLMRQADLADLCEEADLPVLLDAAGRPVTLVTARGYRAVGVLTLDRGIWLEFSDGAVYGLTVSVSHRPIEPGTTRPARRQHPRRRR
jgi:hypothetical protein